MIGREAVRWLERGKAKTYAERDLATFVRCLVAIGADPRIERARGVYGDELIFTWRAG